MTWPVSWVDRLASATLAPVWALECVATGVLFVSAPVVGSTTLALSTARAPAVYEWLLSDDIAFGAQGVQPIEWTAESGAWGVSIAVGADVARLTQAMRCLGTGRHVRLKMGFVGDPIASFQPVAAGQVQALKNAGDGKLRIEVWDLVAALSGRVRFDTRSYPQLFSGMPSAATLTADYTAGDATLTIDAVASGVRRTGGTGAVKVTNLSGDTFYLQYTGISGGTSLTGVGAVGLHGTTSVNAATGSTVEWVPYLYGPLAEIIAQVLTSTGAGTGGAYDVLPQAWGYALKDREDVDVRQIVGDAARILRPAGATDSISVIVDPVPTDSRTWLQSLLSPFGAWLTMRQGLIALRVAQDVRPSASPAPIMGPIAVDAEQVVSASCDIGDWSNVVYISVGAKSTSGTSALGSPFEQYPAYGARLYDLTPFVWSFQPEYRQNVRDRLRWWGYVRGEVISVEMAGLAYWQICPGDVTRLTLSRLGGQYLSTVAGWQDRLALVVRVQPDPLRGIVVLTLATLPDSAADRME